MPPRRNGSVIMSWRAFSRFLAGSGTGGHGRDVQAMGDVRTGDRFGAG
jgi:hypothetical protein